ncbi:hypothetical protein KJS94_09325 [Flavihumibacter rivuli]|uniref:hypothetical protein n=1 Tax=Flavihumibacter rivuli TaxID=2838156 RepID=UPI001BDF2938|nr:hypothetical protein [Flavihumibacter rivuli]ULQ58395.1 hypothetical protein KJS94_09325 [Flavihumibacter rivuli]
MDRTKIRLSEQERRLVTDAGIILTKNAIIGKVVDLFGGMGAEMSARALQQKESLPGSYFEAPPRVSKGEQYQGLPWVMLDYPKSFSKEKVMAIRTFFWWGKAFTVSLLLAGQYHRDFSLSVMRKLKEKDAPYPILVATHEDPWEHDVDAPGSIPLKLAFEEGREAKVFAGDYLKLSMTLGIENWDTAPDFIREAWEFWTGLLAN